MKPAGIRQVAVIATGVIGASWAAYFLLHGLDVIAADPAEARKNDYGPALLDTGRARTTRARVFRLAS
jgi:carnitine 3-dehydrogenase